MNKTLKSRITGVKPKCNDKNDEIVDEMEREAEYEEEQQPDENLGKMGPMNIIKGLYKKEKEQIKNEENMGHMVDNEKN